MRHTIEITKGPRVWLATHSDPAVTALMGSTTLPTPFSIRHVSRLQVVETIAQLNPTCKVYSEEK